MLEFLNLFMCMSVLSICVSVHRVHASFVQRPEEALNALELQSQTAVSYHVDAGKLSPGLLDEKQCS